MSRWHLREHPREYYSTRELAEAALRDRTYTYRMHAFEQIREAWGDPEHVDRAREYLRSPGNYEDKPEVVRLAAEFAAVEAEAFAHGIDCGQARDRIAFKAGRRAGIEEAAEVASEQARIWGEGGSTVAVRASHVACRNTAEYIRLRIVLPTPDAGHPVYVPVGSITLAPGESMHGKPATCARCGGLGELWAPVPDGRQLPPGKVPCPACNGSGEGG